MGTGIKLPPPYACLGMGKFEKEVFKNENSHLDKIKLWKRFIDDVLMLFEGSKDECEHFINWLNSMYPGVIKFKYEFSTEMVEFLDLKIILEDGTSPPSAREAATNDIQQQQNKLSLKDY